MRPDIDGTLNWHKAIELPCDDCPWKEKCHRPDNPVDVGGDTGSLCGLYNGGVRNKKDNSNKMTSMSTRERTRGNSSPVRCSERRGSPSAFCRTVGVYCPS